MRPGRKNDDATHDGARRIAVSQPGYGCPEAFLKIVKDNHIRFGMVRVTVLIRLDGKYAVGGYGLKRRQRNRCFAMFIFYRSGRLITRCNTHGT